MALMDSTSIAARQKKEAVLKAARDLGAFNVHAPERDKGDKLFIQGSDAYIGIKHDGLGSESGAFTIYLVDKNGKRTALGMKTYQGNINANSAWREASLKASTFLKNWANK